MNRAATILFYLLFFLRALGAQQTIVTGTNPNDGAGDSLRNAFRKVNSNFTELYSTVWFTNSAIPWAIVTGKPTTLSGYGITDSITSASVTNYYATKASPTFTGSLTLPSWATAARPASPAVGMIGWNTDLARFDHYVGGPGWKNFVRLDGDTMTGALTAPNFILTGVANTAALALTGYSLTGTNAQSIIDLAGTWNTTGTPTGIKLNLTDTASNAASLLADLQIGGVSKLSVVKTGKILGNGANPYLYLDNTVGSQLGYGTGILNNGGNSLTWSTGGTEVSRIDNTGLVGVANGGGLQWSSTSASSGSKDLFLLRDAANTLALRNGTTAQAFRVYNTYTDASNYERGVMDWTTTANTLTIGTKKAGTGTARDVKVTGAGNTSVYAETGYLDLGTTASQILYLSTANVSRWTVTAAGHLLPYIGNAYDIGSGSYNPRSIYLNSNLLIGAASVGTSGDKVIAIYQGTAPTTSPANTGQIYVESGALKYRSPAGTVTTLAPN